MPAPSAPALVFAITACCLVCASFAAADGRAAIQLSPGRVSFTMKSNGEWTGFGVRGERPLIERGGVVVYSSDPGNTLLDERASSTRGGMRAMDATNDVLFEGMRGGARSPGLQPDDDSDGRVDEDAWDKADNDNDGQTDEDFAAIGDEMVVAIYGTRGDRGVTLRQECYAWSLPHIDGMVASTIVVTNSGIKPIPHARIALELKAASGLNVGAAPAIEGLDRASRDGAFVERQVVLEDRDRGLSAMFLVRRSALTTGATSAVSWDVRGDRDVVTVISPDVGELAPGGSATIHVALVALPADDLKAARAIRNAHRTVVGDGTSRFVPPPVSLTRGEDTGLYGHDSASTTGSAQGGFNDVFWSTSGKLQETLLVGSPNPFRDAITIEYEIPTRAIDEDGIEHDLPSAGQMASVKVYNVQGRLVSTLVDQPHTAGKYRTGWVARDEQGHAVASGVYYVKLQIGKRSVTMRMVQLK